MVTRTQHRRGLAVESASLGLGNTAVLKPEPAADREKAEATVS